MTKAKKIYDEVLATLNMNEKICSAIYDRPYAVENLAYDISKFEKDARAGILEIIAEGKISPEEFLDIIKYSLGEGAKISDLNIYRAIKLASIDKDVNASEEGDISELWYWFFNLVKRRTDRRGVKYLYELAINQEIPWYVAEALFYDYATKYKLYYNDQYVWGKNKETGEYVKVTRKGLKSYIKDIQVALNAAYIDYNDSSIMDIIRRIGLYRFVYEFNEKGGW